MSLLRDLPDCFNEKKGKKIKDNSNSLTGEVKNTNWCVFHLAENNILQIRIPGNETQLQTKCYVICIEFAIERASSSLSTANPP